MYLFNIIIGTLIFIFYIGIVLWMFYSEWNPEDIKYKECENWYSDDDSHLGI